MKPAILRFLSLIMVIAIGGSVGFAWHYFEGIPGIPSLTEKASAPIETTTGGPFTLIDHNGNRVTDASFHGRFMLIYFGYTYCPDMCPVTLTTMAGALDLLGEEGKQIVPVLITLDPERDTGEQLKMYVGYFHPRQVGLTGTVEQVAAAAKAYRIYFAKVRRDGAEPDDYFMDHTVATFLVGPDGKLRHRFSHGISAEAMADRLRDLL